MTQLVRMAPARPETSRLSSGKSGSILELSEEREAIQAGRSTLTLAAQQSARSLREASRPVPRSQENPWSSTPNLGIRKQRSGHSLSHSIADFQPSRLRTTTSSSDPPRPVSHPAPSKESLGSRAASSSSSGNIRSRGSTDASESQSRQNGKQPHRKNRLLTVPPRNNIGPSPARPGAFIPAQAPPHASQMTSPTSYSSLSSPRSVRDLGSDYTRYFNPFITPQSSQNSLSRKSSAGQIASQGATGANAGELSNRLSDPFGDSKRMSNPFESLDDRLRQSNASTPHGPDTCPIHEMHPAVVNIADPPRPVVPAQPLDPEKLAFLQYMDDRLGAPPYTFPLITDAKEDDDDMHMPQWDDDIRLKPKIKDHFTRENIVSTFGLLFMLVGLLCIFVVLPILSWTGTALIDYPGVIDPGPASTIPPWDYVNDKLYPLLNNVRHGLIDPDTPTDAYTRTGINGDTLNLVFSDEFNKKNRTFYPGDDPYWFGFDGWYGATQDLEWYDPDAINTGDGTLQLQLDQFVNHGLDFRSGMLNSWNQLCFKGGIFEVSMSLPGPAGVHGLWPGVWTMGNLGRPGYLSTTDGLWPYTYTECDTGITPNQSVSDGISYLPGQRLPSCTCSGEEHPTPGTGRGAPEIDIAEVSGDWGGMGVGVATQSYQVAPFDIWWYPNYEYMENPNKHFSFVNTYTGGPYQQAVSTTSMLNNRWYDGNEYQKYAFEYVPGSNENAFIAWTIGGEEMMKFDARAIGPNGNIGQRLISEEPMSLILNLGISHSWVDIQFPQLVFPTVMRIDYVRWYQREGEEMVTCDPPGYETTEYIRNHPIAYNNPNITRWDNTGYEWPKNSLMHGCKA